MFMAIHDHDRGESRFEPYNLNVTEPMKEDGFVVVVSAPSKLYGL